MQNLPPAPRSTSRIEELDGVRAICVLMVVLAHETGAGRVPMPESLKPLVEDWAQLGVQLFFGISGFIITRLQLAERNTEGHVSLPTFYLRRFFRIIPAYWAYLFTIVILALFGLISLGKSAVVEAVFFVSNYRFLPPHEGWFAGHSWTLSVEEQYYLFLPFLLWVVLKGRRRSMFIALGILYFLTAYSEKTEWMHLPFHLGFLTSFKYIIAGVLLALVWERATFLFHRVTFVVPLLLLLLLATRSEYTGLSHLLWSKINLPLEALSVVYLLGWCIQNPGPCGFLRWGILQWLGRCSYSIYLWQQLFTGKEELYGAVKLAHLPYSLVMLLACAAFSYYAIERPCMRLGHRLSRKLNPPAPAKAAALGAVSA